MSRHDLHPIVAKCLLARMAPPAARFREEVPNVLLAQLLGARGIVSVPESIERWAGKGQRLPDVIVSFQGLRTVLEGKIGDSPATRRAAQSAAESRVEEGIAHIALGIVYPSSIRSALSLPKLTAQLEAAKFDVCMATESGTQGWVTVNLSELTALLRRTFQHLVREDVVAQAVNDLDKGITQFATATAAHEGLIAAWMDSLGISAPDEEDDDE